MDTYSNSELSDAELWEKTRNDIIWFLNEECDPQCINRCIDVLIYQYHIEFDEDSRAYY